MTAFFTRIARRGVLVVGGGVTPATRAVPATAMVTAAEAIGSVSISGHPGRGGEAGGLQMGNISMQQHWCRTTRPHVHTWRTRLVVLFVCATRRPCGTAGRVSANSTDGPGELPLLTSSSVSFSAWGLPPSVDSLPGRASATRALLASAAVLRRRWSG
jgi:hypothetical protein